MVVNTCQDVARERFALRAEPLLEDALDLPFEEVASVTGLAVGTAKCYAHRDRLGLRERLSA